MNLVVNNCFMKPLLNFDVSGDVMLMSYRRHINDTYTDVVSTCRRHTDVIPTSYRRHIEVISTSYRRHIDVTSTSYRWHIDVISTSYRRHIDVKSTSYRRHIYVIFTSYRRHINVISTSYRRHIGVCVRVCACMCAHVYLYKAFVSLITSATTHAPIPTYPRQHIVFCLVFTPM